MINIQMLGADDKSVRTQITLTKNIKKIVEDMANNTGESLSEYLRKAALMRVMVEQKDTEDRVKLAESVVGALKNSNNPNWKDKESIYRWSRQIREEW